MAEDALKNLVDETVAAMPEVQPHVAAQMTDLMGDDEDATDTERSGATGADSVPGNGSGTGAYAGRVSESISRAGNALFGGADTHAVMDAAGERFDPARHARKTDGTPSFAKDGRFRRKRGTGTGPRPPISPTPGTATAGPASDAQRAVTRAECDATAAVTVETIIMLSRAMIDATEWAASDDEKASMKAAWADYYFATGNLNLPPWAMVAVATGMYALPRLGRENTKAKLQKAMAFFRGKPATLPTLNAPQNGAMKNGTQPAPPIVQSFAR